MEYDFLGIKNENWQAASRDLGAHALQLYLYLASNANNFDLALSPVAVNNAIGMARSTYHDQFRKLVQKGYLVPRNGNTFDFYEVPKSGTQISNSLSAAGQYFESNPVSVQRGTAGVQPVLPENIEINNKDNKTNNTGINIQRSSQIEEILNPTVREVHIPSPKANSKNRPNRL